MLFIIAIMVDNGQRNIATLTKVIERFTDDRMLNDRPRPLSCACSCPPAEFKPGVHLKRRREWDVPMRTAKETARRFAQTRVGACCAVCTDVEDIAALLKRDRRAMARLAIEIGHRERPGEGRISTAKAIQDAILALDATPKRGTR